MSKKSPTIGKHEQKFWEENPDFFYERPYLKNEYSDYKSKSNLKYEYSWQEIEIKKEDIENAVKLQDFDGISINVSMDYTDSVYIESCQVVSFNKEKYDKFLARELEIRSILEKWNSQRDKFNAAKSKDASERQKEDEYQTFLKLKQKYEGEDK